MTIRLEDAIYTGICVGALTTLIASGLVASMCWTTGWHEGYELAKSHCIVIHKEPTQ